MKTKTLLATLSLPLLITACTSLDRHAFRTEQTAVNLVHASYVGWTNYLAQYPVSAEASNTVKEARLKFAATIRTVDGLRQTASTNAAVKPVLRSALLTLADHSSNVVWLVNYYRNHDTGTNR